MATRSEDRKCFKAQVQGLKAMPNGRFYCDPCVPEKERYKRKDAAVGMLVRHRYCDHCHQRWVQVGRFWFPDVDQIKAD